MNRLLSMNIASYGMLVKKIYNALDFSGNQFTELIDSDTLLFQFETASGKKIEFRLGADYWTYNNEHYLYKKNVDGDSFFAYFFNKYILEPSNQENPLDSLQSPSDF